jgi:hypothetical protein
LLTNRARPTVRAYGLSQNRTQLIGQLCLPLCQNDFIAGVRIQVFDRPHNVMGVVPIRVLLDVD